jgi:glutamate N-acetyltransferase/amino-acid N-acetyltransferase
MSVTTPLGFRASGVTAGLKASGKPDVALVVNDGPHHHAAAVFTTNRVEAAPVTWSRTVISDGRADAVVLNSGGANACTGAPGFQDTHRTAEHVGEVLRVAAGDVVVCSTGLIGERLPMGLLLPGVEAAVEELSVDGGLAAATAIITTDAVIEGAHVADDLDAVLRSATAMTFDRIDSDGCMSTNDTVLLMASGASGTTVALADLTDAVTQVCADLARQLIADAEGAHHDIAIEVTGAASEDDALEVARSVARNNLFKCAVFGNDPNWGRVLAAVGTTQALFDPAELDVSMNGLMVCRAGGVGEDRSLVDLTAREVRVVVDLHAGSATATVWTNDLTHDYVHENSAYST